MWWNNARLNDISTILTIRRTCTIKRKENNKIEKREFKKIIKKILHLNIKFEHKKKKKEKRKT